MALRQLVEAAFFFASNQTKNPSSLTGFSLTFNNLAFIFSFFEELEKQQPQLQPPQQL